MYLSNGEETIGSENSFSGKHSLCVEAQTESYLGPCFWN